MVHNYINYQLMKDTYKSYEHEKVIPSQVFGGNS